MSAWAKLGLAGEILVTYIRVRLAMRRTKLSDMVVQIRDGRSSEVEDGVDLSRLSGAVMGLLAVLPTDSRCLVRSLVYLSLISRRGIDGSLVIGARSEPEFAAHAWVEVGGRPALPSGDGEFKPLTVL